MLLFRICPRMRKSLNYSQEHVSLRPCKVSPRLASSIMFFSSFFMHWNKFLRNGWRDSWRLLFWTCEQISNYIAGWSCCRYKLFSLSEDNWDPERDRGELEKYFRQLLIPTNEGRCAQVSCWNNMIIVSFYHFISLCSLYAALPQLQFITHFLGLAGDCEII